LKSPRALNMLGGLHQPFGGLMGGPFLRLLPLHFEVLFFCSID
jgi:hypothetical protein